MIRRHHVWKLKQRELLLGERTLIVGVLNVTPDSFSDGGKYSDPDRAFARAIELEEEGAARVLRHLGIIERCLIDSLKRILGMVLVFIYELTDTLLAPIITHAIFNAVNFSIFILSSP